MSIKFSERLKHAWNAFANKDPTVYMGQSYYTRPDRVHFSRGAERSIVTSVYNKIATDAAQVELKHVRVDENGSFLYEMDSGLNECFTIAANIDQTGRAFLQDIVMSMLDEGCVAIIPTDTDVNIQKGTFDILKLRTGKVVEWYPSHIKARVYNERTGNKEEIIVPKKSVAIVENPFYSVMNEPNSTMQRLIHKLAILDNVDEMAGSGKLNMIIQLPYIIKTDAKRTQAEKRRTEIENQLKDSKYGIAYADGTEKINQLNRPLESKLLEQVEYLTGILYSQLGITKEIMDGTADEKAMNNYYERTIKPILNAIVDEMKRKFLTKTARTQKQDIMFFRNSFDLVPTTQLADLADKLTRNEIMTSNEMRQVIGLKPADDPGANELRNKNISQSPDMQRVDMNGNPIDTGMMPPDGGIPSDDISDEELDKLIEEA
jgi:hypothetical protein